MLIVCCYETIFLLLAREFSISEVKDKEGRKGKMRASPIYKPLFDI